MKNYFALFFLLLFVVSCGNDFSVNGTISSNVIDGEYVYVKRVESGVAITIDSCKVSHSSFKLHGVADSAFIASLYIGNTPILPFVAEAGDIDIDITDNAVLVGGTPLNDKLNALILEQSRLEARMTELERMESSMILNGSTAEAAADYVRDSIDAVGASVERLMNSCVRENFDNVLGPCIFALMYSAVPAPILNSELEALFDDAPESFRSDAFVKAFYDVARENARRLEEQGMVFE